MHARQSATRRRRRRRRRIVESIPPRYLLDTSSMGDVDARCRPRDATNHRHRRRDATARGTTTRVEEDGSGREERRVKRVKRAGEVMRKTSVIGASTLTRGGTWGTSRSSARDVELAGRLATTRRDDGARTLGVRDETTGETVVLVSADAKPQDVGKMVRVKEFVVARGNDGRVVVEAGAVERDDDEAEEGGDERALTCGPLEEEAGVANDARGLNGKVGLCQRGIVEAVSPIISTGASTFFQCAVRAEDGTQAPLIFNGAFLARWECVLRQCIGARVEMRNLRKVVLFKGDPTHEFRAYSASAEFYIVCLDVGPRRLSTCACACATCVERSTIDRYEGYVVDVQDKHGYATVRGADGRVVKLTFTHVPLTQSRLVVPGLRKGAKVVVTHAHPVWRVDEHDDRVLETLGADLRTQVIVQRPALKSNAEDEPMLFADVTNTNTKECRLARSLKYVVEQSSFVYADAVSKWRHALEEKFDIFRDSKLLDIATLEHLLGKKRDGSEEPDHSPAPLLRALCNVESNLQSRSDVYKEFFSPIPLGGDALCSHRAPTIDALITGLFDKWRDENSATEACRRGSTRNEGKVVVRVKDDLRDDDDSTTSNVVIGVLQCVFGRARIVDGSGSMEVCIEDGASGRVPSPSLLNTLVLLKKCEIMCEGPYVGMKSRLMDHNDASIRVYATVNVDDIVVLHSPQQQAETAKTLYLAATLATRGRQLMAPRLALTKSTRQFKAPTWLLDTGAPGNGQSVRIQAYDTDGGVKTLSGVMSNTKHGMNSHISVNFTRQNGWFCLMRDKTTYLLPVIPTASSLNASTYTIAEHPGAHVYALPEDEDEYESRQSMNASALSVQNVRDILVWGKIYSRHVTKGGSWQPSPEMVSFKCVIVAEEWFEEETHSRAIWEPRLKVQDAETHDILDVYCKTSALALPAGFGIGAMVTFHRATRHLSSSTTTMNIYIKINPDVTTVEVHERCGATSEYLPSLASIPTPRRTILSLFEEESRNDADNLVINRRTFDVRARVVSVAMLTVRWCCPVCGCDAGSVMHVKVNGSFDAEKRKLPAALSGCAVCRPAARGAKRPGVFEVEASVTLDDGTAQADCWLTGDAALALTPPNVKNEILPIVQKHGRVTARLTKSSDAERDLGAVTGGHVVRGHASNILGVKDSEAVRSAISHAATLNQMIFECRKQYKIHEQSELSRVAHASAFSFPNVSRQTEIRSGEYEFTINALTMLRVWCAKVTPINPKAELRLSLSQLVTT